MEKIKTVTLKILKALCITVGVLFVVYFWNLDQKLMAWLYKLVHAVADRRKVEKIL